MQVDIFGWLAKNKEWVFSGIGVVVLTAIVTIIRRLLRRPAAKQAQVQQSGASSKNIQAGRDVNLALLASPTAIPEGLAVERHRELRTRNARELAKFQKEGNGLMRRAPNNGTPPEKRKDWQNDLAVWLRAVNQFLITKCAPPASTKFNHVAPKVVSFLGHVHPDFWADYDDLERRLENLHEIQAKPDVYLEPSEDILLTNPQGALSKGLPRPNFVFRGIGWPRLVFSSADHRQGLVEPTSADERENAGTTLTLRFTNAPTGTGSSGRALDVIAQVHFYSENRMKSGDIDYGVWLNSSCDCTDMEVGDTRELILI